MSELGSGIIVDALAVQTLAEPSQYQGVMSLSAGCGPVDKAVWISDWRA